MKLNKLTKAQEKIMNQTREEWINRFNSLEFDEEKAKKLVSKLYKMAGYNKPLIIILDSPLSLQIACNQLKGSQVHSKVDSKVCSQVHSQVISQVSSKVDSKVYSQVLSQVGSQIYSQVLSQVLSQVDSQVRSQVGSQIFSQIFSQVLSQVDSQVRSQVDSQVGYHKLRYFNEAYYGRADDFGWISFYDVFERLGIVKHKLFSELKELFKANIFTSIQQDKVCYVSRPPIFLKRDEKNNMHCLDGEAIKFKDGFGLHYVNGVYFEPELFERAFIKKNLTGKEIIKVKNAEQKAVLINRYGYEFIIKEINAEVIDTYKKVSKIDNKEKVCELLEYTFSDRIKAKLLKMEDHSTDKIYCIGVPPEMKTVKEALKWSYQGTFEPDIES